MEIVKKKSEVPMVDLLEGCDRWEINIDGQHGVVALVDMMPRLVPIGTPWTPPDGVHHLDTPLFARAKGAVQLAAGTATSSPTYYTPRTPTADGAVVQAARTSTGQGLKSEKEDAGLTRYLYRHRHGTPFEMVTFKFYHVLPIFVARQLIRHRMASVNEFSGRYAEVKDRFWIPQATELRKQGAANKQGGDEPFNIVDAEWFLNELQTSAADNMSTYKWAIARDMSKELARVGLGLNLYTEWYWELDLRNLLQFFSLRQDSHAQKEIRVYADAMYELVKPLVPVSIQAYDDYDPNRGGLLLSSLDLRVLNGESTDEVFTNNRELAEHEAKMRRMGNFAAADAAGAIAIRRTAAKSG